LFGTLEFLAVLLKPGAAARQKALVHRFNLRMIH
jgi:hypothetical protein